MAKGLGPVGSIGGSRVTVIASIGRGGRNPLGVIGGNGPENPGFGSIVNFKNPRGEAFSQFLRTQGSDSPNLNPIIQFEPLRAKHLNALSAQAEQLNNNETSVPPVSAQNIVPEFVQEKEKTFKPIQFPLMRPVVDVVRTEAVSASRPVNVESFRVKTAANSEPARTAEISNLIVLERRVLARRIRSRLALARGVQTAPVVNTEAALISQPQTKSETATTVQTVVNAEPKTAVEPQKRVLASPKIRNGEAIAINRREIEEAKRRLYVGTDREVNGERSRELKAVLGRLKTEVAGVVKGDILIESSSIRHKAFRSRLLFQTGHEDLEDGGIAGIESELKGKGNIGISDIEQSIENNNALVRSSLRPQRLAELRELVRVYSAPDRPAVIPPVKIVEEEVSQQVIDSQTIQPKTVSKIEVFPIAEVSGEKVSEVEQILSFVPENILPLVGLASSIFDTGEYINSDAFRRKELINLAA